MKKALFLSAMLCTLAFGSLMAQVRPGVKVALNYSSIESEILPDSDQGVGYSLGGYLDVPVTKRFHFEPTLLYSVKRDKAIINGVTTKMRFNYLDIPFLMRLYVADGFSLFAAPVMSVNLDGKTILESEGIQVKGDTDNVEEMLFCINIGMGYKLENGLNLQVGYEYDWSGSLEKVGTNDPNAHISTVQLSAGYTF